MAKDSIYLRLGGRSEERDIKKLKRALDTFEGVISVSVSESKNALSVNFDSAGVSTDQLVQKLGYLGYQVTETTPGEAR